MYLSTAFLEHISLILCSHPVPPPWPGPAGSARTVACDAEPTLHKAQCSLTGYKDQFRAREAHKQCGGRCKVLLAALAPGQLDLR